MLCENTNIVLSVARKFAFSMVFLGKGILTEIGKRTKESYSTLLC